MARLRRSRALEAIHQASAECFLLCDFARVENGKLYIVGGGWDNIVPQHLPLSYETYLAVKIVLPGESLLDPVRIRIELLGSNEQVLGEPVFESTAELAQFHIAIDSAPPYLPEDFEGTLRVRGAVLMSAAVKMDLAEPGRFSLRLLVDDETVASTSFTVSQVPSASDN